MDKTDNIKRLLINMHCSQCGGNYEAQNIQIMREDEGLLVFQVKCHSCKRAFGMALLGMDSEELEKSLDIGAKTDKAPINYDDVIDAHKFFNNLDDSWAKHLKSD